MQQNVARLRCNDAVGKMVILFHLPHTRLEIATLSPVHGGSARSHVRDAISGCPRRLKRADTPINSVWQFPLMAGRNTILEKGPTQGRVVAVERGVHPSLQFAWHTNARVLRVYLEVHADCVLTSELVWTKIDETRFRAANQTRTRDSGRRSQQHPFQRWDGLKSWSSASVPAVFLRDLLFAGAGQCPGTG